MTPDLGRRLFAEALGTALLVAAVVGSGIAAERLSPGDTGLQLLENALATAAALVAVILAVGPVSGAHLNPVVTVAARLLGGLTTPEALGYVGAQLAGGAVGAVVANVMFEVPVIELSGRVRSSGALWTSEAVATFGLVVVVFGVVRSRRTSLAPLAVASYIGAAYLFTSSTSFANPAVTLARTLSDTFAGIAPSSVPVFVVAQLVGAGLAIAAVRVLYPSVAGAAPEIVVPHPHRTPADGPVPAAATGRHPPAHNQRRVMSDSRALEGAATRLAQEFSGVFGMDTVERFLATSFEQLAGRATVASFLPLMAERFARQRLQALARVDAKVSHGLPVVLFLCVHNAGRSQMALGWFNHLAGGEAVAWSGGSAPGEEVNPAAIAAMAEVGIDISKEFPKPWTDEIVRAADVVVTMGCGDACPLFPGKRYEDWVLDDPAGQPIDAVRPVRDEIGRRVMDLLVSLGVQRDLLATGGSVPLPPRAPA